MKDALIKIIKIGAILALFTPFVFSKSYYFPFVGPKSLYFMALAEIIFFAWLVLVFKFPQYRPKKGFLTVTLFTFLAVSVVSSIFGANPSQSFWSDFERLAGVLMMLHLFGFYLVTSSVFDKKDWLLIFKISIVLAAAMGMFALFDTDAAMSNGATIGNDSFLGTYLLFNIFFTIYLFLNSWDKASFANKAFPAICFLALATALFRSQAQAAKISLLGGLFLILLFWLIFIRLGASKKIGVALLAVFLFFGSTAIYLSTQPNNFIYQKMIKKFGENTLYERIVVWNVAWNGFLDKPFLGWGPENFQYAYAKNYNPCMGEDYGKCGNSLWYDKAHNIVFDTLVDTGIIGLMAYIGVFVSALYLLWKKFLKEKNVFWETSVITALILAYELQNLTVFDMVESYLMLFLVFGFIATVVRPMAEEQNKAKVAERKLGFWKAGGLVVVFLISFTNFVLNPLSADHNVVEAVSKPFGSKDRIAAYEKTMEASPMGIYQIRQFFASTLLDYYGKQNGKLTPDQQLREYTFLAGELEKSDKEVPTDFHSRLILGQLYNYWYLIDSTKLDRASQVLEEVVKLSPTNQQGYWQLAQTRMYQGRFDDAEAAAQKAVDLDPNFFQSKRILQEVQRIKGEYAQRMQQLQ